MRANSAGDVSVVVPPQVQVTPQEHASPPQARIGAGGGAGRNDIFPPRVAY